MEKGVMKISDNQYYIPPIAALGAGAMITQLVYLREFLALLNGNELVIGLVLAGWMLLTGAGAKLGRAARSDSAWLPALMHILLGIIPVLTLWLLRHFRNDLFDAGRIPGFFEASTVAFGAMLPFCIVSGMLLNIYSRLMSDASDNRIAGVYMMDTIGAIGGGAAFSFLFVYIFNSFANFYVVAILNFLAAGWIALHSANGFARRAAFWMSTALILATGAMSFLDIDRSSLDDLFAGQELIESRNSEYGRGVVTRTAEQLNFYENGVFLFSTDNPIAAEESAHYAMIQRPGADTVLMISGGASGGAAEALKYNPRQLDYVEINPAIIELARKYTNNLDDPRI
ncbi:MAG: hypothetical protein ACLFQX_11960, partial [Candidatus Kapaibacterium sp.]